MRRDLDRESICACAVPTAAPPRRRDVRAARRRISSVPRQSMSSEDVCTFRLAALEGLFLVDMPKISEKKDMSLCLFPLSGRNTHQKQDPELYSRCVARRLTPPSPSEDKEAEKVGSNHCAIILLCNFFFVSQFVTTACWRISIQLCPPLSCTSEQVGDNVALKKCTFRVVPHSLWYQQVQCFL